MVDVAKERQAHYLAIALVLRAIYQLVRYQCLADGVSGRPEKRREHDAGEDQRALS